jgi:glycosyltransferase involved in cell wall biosynthesis
MPSARVAVVIPTFNNAATLVRTVESVIVATDHANASADLELHTEIVVVDDGSTDDTRAVFDCLAAHLAPLPAITFKTASTGGNRGAGPARNTGVRHASAPLICFLDADDEFLPPHLDACVRALLDDREIGYVWTRRQLDVPMHPSWGPSLDRSTVMNLCIRRIWHEIVKGFPEHPDFRTMGTEDSFYRIVLRALVPGREIDMETVLIHHAPGNSLDRQRDKLATPVGEWDGAKELFVPSDAIMATLQERLEYVERLKGEISA